MFQSQDDRTRSSGASYDHSSDFFTNGGEPSQGPYRAIEREINKSEQTGEQTYDDILPNPGMDIDKDRTALVITDPQRDFLSEDGVVWGVVGESVQENTPAPSRR